MLRRKVFKPGDDIARFEASDYNEICRELEKLANLSVSGQLELFQGMGGRSISRIGPGGFWATLSGSTSPYSFTETIPQAGDAWFAAYRTGTTNAHEVNAKSGLGGKRAWLRPGAYNEWLFQWVGFSSVCEDPTRICVTISITGCNIPAYGALVEIEDNTSTLVGSCTADGVIRTLTLNSGGSGYTNGTGYALGFSGGGGSGATGTFDVVGGAVTNVVLTANGTGYTSAASVTFPGAGAGTGASVTANMGGRCCVDIANSGTYTVRATIPGATPVETTVSAICGVDNLVGLTFPTNSIGTACITFDHGGYADGGDTIVISKAGTPVATITTVDTGTTGMACVHLGTGNYTYSLTTPQGLVKTGSFAVSACATTNHFAGGSTVQVCLRVETEAPAGCDGTFTVKLLSTGETLGTCDFTTATVGFFIVGECCMTIAERLITFADSFDLFVAFPNFSTHISSVPINWYGPGAVLFTSLGGSGPPC